MQLNVELQERSYPIYIERSAINNLSKYIDVNKKIMLVTDDGVPKKWVETIHAQCKNSFIVSFSQGESSKNIKTYQAILQEAIQHQLTRNSAILSIGGGVVGDLAGFVAATYMRGIDFYNIPTTLLSQVDSSVGGKVAIDMDSYKNIVGAFWQPKAVIIDPNVLETLPQRHIHNGLIEALKTGLIQDEKLVSLFEEDTLDIDQIIYRSILVKKQIVEQDEKESGLRKILNFGHTIGHAIEGAYGFNTYLHGECVALGMLFFVEDPNLKERLYSIYQKLDMPTMPAYDPDTLMRFILHDKKSNAHTITICFVNKVGTYRLEEVPYDTIYSLLERKVYEK